MPARRHSTQCPVHSARCMVRGSRYHAPIYKRLASAALVLRTVYCVLVVAACVLLPALDAGPHGRNNEASYRRRLQGACHDIVPPLSACLSPVRRHSLCLGAFIPQSPRSTAAADKPAATAYRNDPYFKQMKDTLGRGINLGNALEAPRGVNWGVTLKAEYFAKIKAAGFTQRADSRPLVGLRRGRGAFYHRAGVLRPCRLGGQRGPEKPARARAQHALLRRNFQGPRRPPARFVALWRQIAEHYREFSPQLVFELLNEPNGKLDAAHWNPLVAETLGTIRRSNPTRRGRRRPHPLERHQRS